MRRFVCRRIDSSEHAVDSGRRRHECARILQESCNVVKHPRLYQVLSPAPPTWRPHCAETDRPDRDPRPQAGRSRHGFLTVGQTARILGVSPSTLRLWESVGLVAPIRSNGKYRLYSPELLKVLKRIKYLREVQRLNVPGIKRETRIEPTRRSIPSRSRSVRKLLKLRNRTRARHCRRGTTGGHFSRVSQLDRTRTGQRLGCDAAATRDYLSTTVMDLFQAPRRKDGWYAVHDRRVLETDSGVRMELLSTGAPMLQSMLFRVAPLAGSDGSYSHQGEEFIYMMSGHAGIWLDELRVLRSQRRRQLLVRSTLGHRWFNPGKEDAVLLWINTPPSF